MVDVAESVPELAVVDSDWVRPRPELVEEPSEVRA